MSGKFLATAPVYPDPNDDFYMTLKKFSVLFGQIQSGAVAPFPISGGGGGGGGGSTTIVTTDPSGAGTAGSFQFNSVNGKIWAVVSGTWTLLFVCALTVTNIGASFMCPDGNIRTATLSS